MGILHSEIKGRLSADQDKIVIGHRGAAGYIPEHTLAGYAFGYALGADYVEPDLVTTKDDVLICLHDIYLEPTTNVAQVFPDRQRSDGHWYAVDFTIAEIKRLTVHERCKPDGAPYFPGRFPVGESHFEVPTFAEMIALVQGLNKSTGRNVGIYPELKRPKWHVEQGHPMEGDLYHILTEYGYTDPNARVYVQCFRPGTLMKLREIGAEVPLIQLIDDTPFVDTWTRTDLEAIAVYAAGIGPAKAIIEADPTIVSRAHTCGLVVHPYTFRRDQLPDKYPNFRAELEQFYFEYGVDGLFTDFPDIAAAVLAERKKGV